MRKITKSPEPESLKRYKREVKNNDWSYMHENNHDVYDDILIQSVVDQNDVCGYTEVKLTEKKQHIDHFIKRAIDPRQSFVWENMIAAVHDEKFGSDYKDNTVKPSDYDRARSRYIHILSPVTDDITGRFRYGTDGIIEPVDADDTDAAATISVFNLNEESLVNRRKAAMQSARTLLQEGETVEEIKAYLDEFPSAVEYEIGENGL